MRNKSATIGSVYVHACFIILLNQTIDGSTCKDNCVCVRYKNCSETYIMHKTDILQFKNYKEFT